MDGEGDVFQSVEFAIGIPEGKIPHFDTALGGFQLGNVFAVFHIDFCIQQFAHTGQGCFATAGHVDQFGNGHDGPDDAVEIADKFQKLAGVQHTFVYQIAAVADDDADDALHKEHDHHTEQHGSLGVCHVGFFVFYVQLLESPQLFSFFHESLDHGDAGEAFLGEIRKPGVGLLAGIPLLCQALAYDGGGSHQERHGDQG